jgi:hypothetical protein
MPRIDNPKHELFAQELAKGKSQAEAYELAGYKGDRTAASRLSTNDNVQARVAELVGRAAERAEISVASVTEDLKRIALAAEQLGGASGLSVARAAAMDVVKLNGLIVEKKEVRTSNFLDEMSYEERLQFRAMLVAEIERRTREAGGQRVAGSGQLTSGTAH